MSCTGEHPLYTMDDPRLIWLKEEFLPKLKSWENHVKTHHKGEWKRMLPSPTHEGILFTTHNFIALAERILSLPSIKYICLGTFTQDVLEAMFGNLRQLGKYSQNPDITEAAYGIQHIIQRRAIKKMKGGNTSHGKKNVWSTVSHEPVKLK
ncbi:uncharacterized protein LOC144748085 [Ciona intestinalis]